MRVSLFGGVIVVALLALPGAASAQGKASAEGAAFGIGGHFSFVRQDVNVDAESVRFTGGQIRARLSPRTAFELSLDVHTETNALETARVRQYPIQASLLLFLARSKFSPFVLGGAGWYARKVEVLAGDETLTSETTRDFGWHAGFGAELRLGSHVGLHGDYRYTFLDFGKDDEDQGVLGRFLPGYKGSMWTAGMTLYF
jgi:opacity protein-like surface antigen